MSSLRYLAQDAYICSQCRSHLARINAKPPRTARQRSKDYQRRTFSTRPGSLQQLDSYDSDYLDHPTLFDNSAAPADIPGQGKNDIRLPNDHDRGVKSSYFSRRLNLYSKDALGVTTLGKPAEVLRIQERDKRAGSPLFREQKSKRSTLTEPLKSSDIIERINAERGLVSTARASQNVEQLKQDWLSGLEHPDLAPTESECSELGSQLYDGFTTKQLFAYLKGFRVPLFSAILDLNGSFRSESFTRSEWKVGLTPFPGDAPQRLHSLSGEGNKHNITSVYSIRASSAESRRSGDPVKHILVNRIIRQCWKIKPREELDLVGEVDIKLPETHLELLASHKRNILQQLTVEYDAKIDFSKVENIVRLTANQVTCLSSLKLLLMILNEISCHEMTSNEYGAPQLAAKDCQSLLNGTLLREIERLSGTVIRWSEGGGNVALPNRTKLRIYSMGNDKKSLDDAKWFIWQACRTSRSRATSAFYGGHPPTSTSLGSVPVAGTNSLSLTDRGTEWTRMSCINNDKDTQTPADFSPSETLDVIKGHVQAPHALIEIGKHLRDHPHWIPSLFQESSTALGLLLYPAKTMNLVDTSESLPDTFNRRHVFDTDVPGVARALELQLIRAHRLQELRVRLKATAINNTDANNSLNLPELEIRLTVKGQERDILVLQSVRLILNDREADLLLPHEALDLRFATRVYVKAAPDIDPRIVNFLDSTNFASLWQGQKLETPKELTIGIPEQLLSWGKASKGSTGKEVPVSYSVAGIEHHHVVYGLPAQGKRQQMSVSIIDAGPIGGRRQQVRFSENLHLGKGWKGSTIDNLYGSAHDLFRRLVAPDLVRKELIAHDVVRKPAVRDRGLPARQVLSDAPVGSDEAERSKDGRIRRVVSYESPSTEGAVVRRVLSPG